MDTEPAVGYATANQNIAKSIAKSVTLTFIKPEEIEAFNDLLELADEKDYSLSKFIVRVLTGKETFGTETD